MNKRMQQLQESIHDETSQKELYEELKNVGKTIAINMLKKNRFDIHRILSTNTRTTLQQDCLCVY